MFQSNPQLKNKSASLSSVMKNPKLAKLMNEALAAPLGSTKRDKAKAILASLNKTGQGVYGGGVGGGFGLPITGNKLQPAVGANMLQPTVGANTLQPNAGAGVLNQGTQQAGMQVLEQPNQPNIQIPDKRDVVPGIPLPKDDVSTISSITPPYGEEPEGLKQWYRENPNAFIQYMGGNSPAEMSSETPEGIPAGMWSDLKNATKLGIGEEMWKYTALPKLKEWFPNVPEEDLPIGAIWTDDFQEIKKRLDEEYQLDNQLNKISKMESQGLTIESDLQAYIRGRDENIKNVNKMIDNVNNIYSTQDVSDPRKKAMLDKYRNYLYIVKGRTVQRYTDYVDRSVEEHDAKAKRLADLYNINIKRFEDELASEKEITKEKFTMYRGMLGDLYSQLNEREIELKKENDGRLEKLDKSSEQVDSIIERYKGDSGGMSEKDLETSLNNFLATNLDVDASDRWEALSDDEKRRWLTKGGPMTKEDLIRRIQIMDKGKGDDKFSDEEITDYIILKGFDPEEFKEYYEGNWFTNLFK